MADLVDPVLVVVPEELPDGEGQPMWKRLVRKRTRCRMWWRTH